MKVITLNTRVGLLTFSETLSNSPFIIVSEKEIRKNIIAATMPMLITSESGFTAFDLKRSRKYRIKKIPAAIRKISFKNIYGVEWAGGKNNL